MAESLREFARTSYQRTASSCPRRFPLDDRPERKHPRWIARSGNFMERRRGRAQWFFEYATGGASRSHVL